MRDAPMSEDDIVAVLKTEYEAADDYCGGEIEERQALALKYYEAEPFGDEIEGRSQVVSPDVQEAVDYMTISVLKPFVSGDKVVEFEAESEEDEPAAEEATAAVAYNFTRQQDGYKIVHDWLQSGLLEIYGAVKTAAVMEQRTKRETLLVDDEQLALVPEDELESISDNGDGTFNVVIKRQITRKRFVDITIPSEELRFSARAKHEDDCDYIAHVSLKTRSELVEMGFDADQVYDLPTHEATLLDWQEQQRDRDFWKEAESSEALATVLLCEEYARMDVDGDGIAERVKVFRVADQILRDAGTGELSIETVDEQPIVIFCPFPRAHRLVGYSYAEKAMDIQRLRSVVQRQMLDGMYNANMPRLWVPEESTTENTFDDILTPIAGSPIRGRGSPPTEIGGKFNVGTSLSVLEFYTAERETRLGVTRLNQGIDANSINKTATGALAIQAKGEQMEEFVARNFAEALARLFAKKLRLMKAEGEPFRIKVDGQYKQANPAAWPDEMNVAIRVGLGTGSKDRRIQQRLAIAPMLGEGFQQGLVDEEGLFNAFDGLVRDMGLGKGDDFWIDPSAPPEIDPETGQPKQKAEKPDPAMAEAQAKAMIEAEKMKGEQQKAQAQMQIDQMKMQADIELQREKHAMDMEAKREANALAAQLARDKAAQDADLAERKAMQEADLAERKFAMESYLAQRKTEAADMSQNRPGGDLDK